MSSQSPIRARISPTLLAFSAVILSFGTTANADLIDFNPTGGASTSTLPIGGIDFGPGNALTRGAIEPVVGQTFQLHYQASVIGYVNEDGLTTTLTGPDLNYQLTAVGSFTQVVTSVNSQGVATFMLAASQSSDSFFELYYSSTVARNYGSGVGFNLGTRILSGTPAIGATSQGTLPLAQGGAGSFGLSLDVTTFDPSFFETAVDRLTIDSTLTSPNATNPSAAFYETAGPGAPTLSYDPAQDVRYVADAGITFVAAAVVPEPASLLQATLGLLGVTGVAGWRSSKGRGHRPADPASS